MNKKYNNIVLSSGDWHVVSIPCMVFKHRVLKSDPTYKFVINADIHIKSNVTVRNNNDTYYYDLLNMLAPTSNAVVTGLQFLDLLESKYNIVLIQGGTHNSAVFPELSFISVEDRDLLDTLYDNLSGFLYNDGLNSFIDFTLHTSGGFVRNKLGIDTNNIRPFLLNNLSFNLLSKITEKLSGNNFKVKNNYITALELSSFEVTLIEKLAAYNPTSMPKDEDGVPYIWKYINSFTQSLSLTAKQYLFGFFLENISITDILNKDFHLNVDANNYPINVVTKTGSYNELSQTITVSKP